MKDATSKRFTTTFVNEMLEDKWLNTCHSCTVRRFVTNLRKNHNNRFSCQNKKWKTIIVQKHHFLKRGENSKTRHAAQPPPKMEEDKHEEQMDTQEDDEDHDDDENDDHDNGKGDDDDDEIDVDYEKVTKALDQHQFESVPPVCKERGSGIT